MEFLILGPLEISADGRTLALGGPKQRAVFAHLILRANRLVPVDLLIDGLWGEEPPGTAKKTLQTYVYRLRQVLGEDRIASDGGGYLLRAESQEIDAARFEELVRQGKARISSDPEAAVAILSDALSLWRGNALADLTEEPSLRGEIARLEELRLSATEHRIAAEIATGGHSTVVSELEALTARYPLRERMWANLMLALYRSGRQAEALSTFERARQVLADELGADPSPELQRLHQRILDHDLADPEPAEPRPPPVRSSRVDLQPGTEVAGYRIERTLGRGGMSVVYLAEHDWLQRKVALKVLAPQLAEDERFRERFVRESRLAASLDHPNVIPIYEAGASGGDLFIAMRYVEGTDLRTLLHEGGALEPARAVAIVRQVAAALDAAHEQGLVHRDVKPGNVLLARQRGSEAGEHVYLSDFGLTKRSASDSGITGTGQFVGTLDYAAPEQFQGGTPDARTDVYSLGCVLFECLTGTPPFTSENDAGLMYAHLQQPPPSVTAERPDLPGEIDAVVARAMAKAPADRQPTAGALAGEAYRALGLGAFAGTGGSLPRRAFLRRLVPVLAVVLALVLGVMVSSLLRADTPGSQESRNATATPSPTPPPNFRTVERALAPEEKRLLGYVPQEVASDCAPLDRPTAIQEELAALVCRSADVEVLYELFPTRDLMDAAFQINANNTQAPAGECATRHLAVADYTIDGERAGRVLCYTIGAGLSRQQIGEPSRAHIEWTDENSLIYAHAIRNDLGDLTLYEWWLTSAGPVVPAGGGDPIAKDRPSAVAGAPRDGTYLAFPRGGCTNTEFATLSCRLHIDGDAYELEAIGGDSSLSETGRILIQKPDAIVFAPITGYCLAEGRTTQPAVYRWSASGGSVAFQRTRGGACAGPAKATVGDPRYRWTRAPTGTIAFEQEGQVTLIQPGGAGAEQLATELPTLPNKDPDWSPDGSKILFAGSLEDDDLFVMDADGSGITQLTDDAFSDEYDPVWSPDGTQIAFAFDNLGGFGTPFVTGIVVMDATGGHRETLIERTNERLGWPAWSPDGRRIAFSGSSSNGFRLYVMDSDGSDVTVIHEEPPGGLFAMPVSWTPDGERVVFWGRHGGKPSLLSIRPDGTDVHELLHGLPPGARPLTVDWSPDGRWIVAGGVWDLTAVTARPSLVYLIRAEGGDAFAIAGSGSEPSWRPELG
jgi:serine/threonine protein kinase/Tol biopolymer transport system component